MQGCSIETIWASSYSKEIMGKFESTHIYPNIRDKAKTYLRYIDDLFFIWKGTKEELLSFIDDLNKKTPSIKFDCKYSKREIQFMDTKIYKYTNSKPCLTIYRKPTNRQNYLHFKSAYPPSLKKSSQALCISNICAETNEVMKHLTRLK